MNLGEYLYHAVQRFPEAVALVENGRRWTYRELWNEVEVVAARLQQQGLSPGDHALVVLKNRWQNVVIYWACQRLGLIYTPLNFRMAADEVAYCVQDADPTVAFFEASLRPLLEQALGRASRKVFAVDVGEPDSVFERELRKPGRALEPPPTVPDDATALMLYTSGTTGRPKGVPRSHVNEVSAALAHIIQNRYQMFESTVGVMPFYHTMGMRSLLVTAFLNGKLVLIPDYRVEALAQAIATEHISSLYLVPTLYFDLVYYRELDRLSFKALTKIGYAGAPMTKALTELCFERLKPQVFVNHFGSSEVYTFTVCSWLDRKPGCAGRAGIHEVVRVVRADPEPVVHPDEVVRPGETGEVIVSLRSPEAFAGYWRRPDANRRALRAGWYFTGDLGSWDEEGDLWVLGRVDDMLVSGGENIHPLEVEEVLARHPKVQDVAVAGLPDERWGQIVAAFVVPRDPRLTAEELDQFCRTNPSLAAFKRPRRYVFVNAIPKSPVGKILRRKLQAGEYQRFDAAKDLSH